MMHGSTTHDRTDEQRATRARRTRAGLVLLGAVILLTILGGVWRFTGLSELAEAARVAAWLEQVQTSPWAPLWIVGLYLIANAVLFPTLLLNMGVVLALGSAWGFTYAMLGSVSAGMAFYAVGRAFGRKPLERLKLRRLTRVIDLIKSSGAVGMAVLRLVPVAPHPVINVALGAAGIRSMPYFIGTTVGIFPSILAMTAVGHQLHALTDDPSPRQIAVLAAIVIAAVAGLWMVQRLARRKLDTVAPQA